MEKAKKPYKNMFFKVVIQKCENQKKWIFSKNWLTLFVSGREKNAHFHTIKTGVSVEIAKKQKWHLFFGKRCFLTWLKKWVLLTVFLKSCVLLKTLFSKTACWKNNRNLVKSSGLFLNMAKWCFGGLFFEVLILKGLFLVCLALFQKC